MRLLGIGRGNPGVEKGYPYPNPKIPIPGMPGRRISGLGSQVPLVPSVYCQVVKNTQHLVPGGENTLDVEVGMCRVPGFHKNLVLV